MPRLEAGIGELAPRRIVIVDQRRTGPRLHYQHRAGHTAVGPQEADRAIERQGDPLRRGGPAVRDAEQPPDAAIQRLHVDAIGGQGEVRENRLALRKHRLCVGQVRSGRAGADELMPLP